ncbi:hypothetical protein MP11Mi_10500 [Gordonia sp. MP11Mi]|uniref:Uncharacterized protein n=1 Tax=Gordonia sp. MP11Mi TaxID=3022769 RepID=A0AA97CTA0_9ACTN
MKHNGKRPRWMNLDTFIPGDRVRIKGAGKYRTGVVSRSYANVVVVRRGARLTKHDAAELIHASDYPWKSAKRPYRPRRRTLVNAPPTTNRKPAP